MVSRIKRNFLFDLFDVSKDLSAVISFSTKKGFLKI